MKITVTKKQEIQKIAENTGISQEALIDLENMKALCRSGGIDALEQAGYTVYRGVEQS